MLTATRGVPIIILMQSLRKTVWRD